jgi:hypothetical protein
LDRAERKKKQHREAARRYYYRHQVKCQARSMARRNKDPAAENARLAAWRAANRDRLFDEYLQEKYGISAETYARLALAQNNRCAVCAAEKPLAVDHDHVTSAVRGLLCRNCNAGIGLLGDTLARAEAAVRYLKGSVLE